MRKAIIVGGSVAGLFAALALQRIGWAVVVLERSVEPLSARGAGIATHPNLLDALRQVGVASVDAFGVMVERRVVLDSSGMIVAEAQFKQLMTAWDRLHRALMETFDRAPLSGRRRRDQNRS